MRKELIIVNAILLLVLCMLVNTCVILKSRAKELLETVPPTTDPLVTEEYLTTELHATERPTTEPFATQLPTIEPPITEQPITEPPMTEQPTTEFPAVELPPSDPEGDNNFGGETPEEIG